MPAGAAAMLTCAAFAARVARRSTLVLMTALVALGALTLTAGAAAVTRSRLRRASLFPSLVSRACRSAR